jgi:hypothetical protein
MKLVQLFPMSGPGWCSVFGRWGVGPAEAGTPNLPRKRSELGQRLGLRWQSGSVEGAFERRRSVEVSNPRRADESGVALPLCQRSPKCWCVHGADTQFRNRGGFR